LAAGADFGCGAAVNLVMPILLLGGFYAIKGDPYQSFFAKPIVLSEFAAKRTSC